MIIDINLLYSASKDYQTVVLPHYREEAAKTIQSRWRKQPLYRAVKLTELTKYRFYNALVSHIRNNRYDLIEYNKPHFTRCLFSALRYGAINMNALITAKLMYDSLLCFNNGTIPKQPHTTFSRHLLNDLTGPWQCGSVDYLSDEKTTTLKSDFQIQMATVMANEQFHYYTINIPITQVHIFLLATLSERFYTFIQSTHKQVLVDDLACDYINAYCSDSQKKQFIQNGKVQVDMLRTFMFCNQNQLNISDKDKENAELIAALFVTDSNMPFLCRKSLQSQSMPLLSFVIPTIDTFNALQHIAHGMESSIPVGVVGTVTTRMIRAYDEIPPALHSKLPLSKTQKMLKMLYPAVNTLSANARPLELTHPDIKNTSKCHGYDCDDFLLSWHDLFHAWRNGANFKAIFRALRQLHDETAGLDNSKQGMSKAIWALSDLEINQGAKIRRHQYDNESLQSYHKLSAILFTFRHAGFKYCNDHDDNYLISYHVLQQNWRALFFQSSLKELYDSIRSDRTLFVRFEDKHDYQYEVFLSYQEKVSAYLKQHPNATLLEVILSERLQPLQIGDSELLNCLREKYKTILKWSKNNGLYFKKTVEFPGLLMSVRQNSPERLRAVLYSCLTHKDQYQTLAHLIKMGDVSLVYGFINTHPWNKGYLRELVQTKGNLLLETIMMQLKHPMMHVNALLLLELLLKNYCFNSNKAVINTIRHELDLWPANNLFYGEKSQWIKALQIMNEAGYKNDYDQYRIAANTVIFSWFTLILLASLSYVMHQKSNEIPSWLRLCFNLLILNHLIGCFALNKIHQKLQTSPYLIKLGLFKPETRDVLAVDWEHVEKPQKVLMSEQYCQVV